MSKVSNTYDSVYVKGIRFKKLLQFNSRLAYSDKLVENIAADTPIQVDDEKTYSYVKGITNNIVSQSESVIRYGVKQGVGKRVSLMDIVGSLNLRTRNNISNLNHGKHGNVKEVLGNLIRVDHFPVPVIDDYNFLLFNPVDYETEQVIRVFEKWEGYYIAYLRRPSKVRQVYENGRYLKVVVLGKLERYDNEGRQLYFMVDEYDPFSVTRSIPTSVDVHIEEI